MANTKLYKGSLVTIILKLLQDNDKMYGYEITQKVKELTKGELNITEGALYPALHKLEAEGFLLVESLDCCNSSYSSSTWDSFFGCSENEENFINEFIEPIPPPLVFPAEIPLILFVPFS